MSLITIRKAPLPAVAHYRFHGPWVLPDLKATPGAIRTTDTALICHQSTKHIRHVTAAMHRAIFAEYGIPWSQHRYYEDDHVISLELGGDNPNPGRFPQPYPQAYSKDSVENWAHAELCAGRLSVAYVQRQIVQDWVVLYERMKRSTHVPWRPF